MRDKSVHPWLVGALVALAALAAHLPEARNGYIWDDPDYVTENLTLTNLHGLGQIWFEPTALPQYYPLVHTTYWIEYHLWGLDPLGYHLNNIALNCLAAVLLLAVLRKLGLPTSAAGVAAAVWAVHPLNVETVAWITERKNTLEMSLYLASLLAYLCFDPLTEPPEPPEHPEFQQEGVDSAEPVLPGRMKWYALSLLFFVGAMLSKTVACSLPVTILLLVWWKRGRIAMRDVVRLAPMFALGLALGLNTVLLERRVVGASGSAFDLSFADRVLIAGKALWFYAGKLAWPWQMIFIYPRWEIDAAAWAWWLWPATAAGAMAGLWLARGKIGRGPAAAGMIFGVTLFPALGFFNIYPMKYSFVADHFQYQAGAALIALAAGVLARERIVLVMAGVACCVAMIVADWSRIPVFKDQETLWVRTIEQNPRAWIAYNNLGSIRMAQGELEKGPHAEALLAEARQWFEKAYEINPHDAGAPANLALLAQNRHDDATAIKYYRLALAQDDRDVRSLVNLAAMLMSAGELDEALPLYERAHALMPAEDPPRLGLSALAKLFLKRGKAEEDKSEFVAAESSYRKAIAAQGDWAEAHNALGVALAVQGKLAEAADEFAEAVKIDPYYKDARENLATAKRKMDEDKTRR